MSKTNGETMSKSINKETKMKYEDNWVKKRLANRQCTKCKEKAANDNKWYCEKHRNDLNKRRRVEYLEEKFKKKYKI